MYFCLMLTARAIDVTKFPINMVNFAEFESQSSSLKDFLLTYLFFGGGGLGMVNLLPLGTCDMSI